MDKIELKDIFRFGEIETLIDTAIFENYNERTNKIYGYNMTSLSEYHFLNEVELVRVFFIINNGEHAGEIDDFYITYNELLESLK